MRSMKEGDEIELGGRGLMAVEPVIRDLRTTWWGFDARERVLFPGDGFAYSHYHEDGHCGLVAEEAVSLDLPDVSSTFADLALFWTKFADMNVYCDRLDHLIERLDIKTIAPTHGLLKEGVVLRGVPAPYGVCLMVDVFGGTIRMQHEPFHIGRTEMEHAGFMVIDPDDRMKVMATHGIGPFAGRVPNCVD